MLLQFKMLGATVYNKVYYAVTFVTISLPPNTFFSVRVNWRQRSRNLGLAQTLANEIHSYARSADHLINHQTRGRHNVLASSLDHFPSDVNASRFTNLFPLPAGSTWLNTLGASCSKMTSTHRIVILFWHIWNHKKLEESENHLSDIRNE